MSDTPTIVVVDDPKVLLIDLSRDKPVPTITLEDQQVPTLVLPMRGARGADGAGTGGAVTVVWAPSITIDVSLFPERTIDLTLTGDCEINFTGFSEEDNGKSWILRLTQDGVGGHDVLWGASVSFSLDIPSVPLLTDPGSRNNVALQMRYATSKMDVIAYVRGFA